MGKVLNWKFLSCLLLCLAAGLLLSVPAGAVDVSDPVLDTTTKGEWRGVYGDCFVLLPDPKCTGFPEPEFGSALDGVCTTELDDFVTTFDLRRQDGRPANTFWNTVNDCTQPESSSGGLCGTVAEQFGSCGQDFSMCDGSAQWNPCVNDFKGALWDEGDCFTPGGVVPPLIAELTIDFEGSTELAYYFAAGCGSSRTQNWWLYIDGVVVKSGVITVTGNGQYLVFQLADVVPGTVIRFETQNQVPTQCNPDPPPPGGPPNNSVLSGVFLSDCEQPCIEIVKEVSVDGGQTFDDANLCADAPGTDMDATYRLTVKNCGNIDLEDVKIWDPTLGVMEADAVNIGDLPAGGAPQVFTASDTNFGFLNQPERCPDGATEDTDNFNNKLNTAFVSGDPVTGGLPVTDDDPACVKCECIDIEKLVSVDGGNTFVDADECEDAPGTLEDAEYKLVVTNCGATRLTDVTVKDPVLGIDVNIGALDPGEVKTFTKTSLGFENLGQPGICPADNPEIENVATVTTFEGPTDSDPACVKCECIDIEKLVSVDGGQTFVDADECELAPTTNSDAEYKLVVTNCGAIRLTEVTVKDPVLGIEVNIGALDPGEVKTFTKDSPGFGNLDTPGICPDGDQIENVATVTTFEGPTDSDPACIKCCPLEVEKEVFPETIECVDSGTDSGTDGDPDACICPCEDSGTDGDAECVVEKVTYTYTIRNTGDVALLDVTVFDDQLGILAEFPVLGPGETEIIQVEDVCLCEETTNKVTVTAILEDGTLCTAMDEATVTTDLDCLDTGTDGP